MALLLCPQCGFDLLDDEQVCPNCGFELNGSAPISDLTQVPETTYTTVTSKQLMDDSAAQGSENETPSPTTNDDSISEDSMRRGCLITVGVGAIIILIIMMIVTLHFGLNRM